VIGQRGTGFKLKEGRSRLEVRRKFFTRGVVRHCHWLPREAVDASFLEAQVGWGLGQPELVGESMIL